MFFRTNFFIGLVCSQKLLKLFSDILTINSETIINPDNILLQNFTNHTKLSILYMLIPLLFVEARISNNKKLIELKEFLWNDYLSWALKIISEFVNILSENYSENHLSWLWCISNVWNLKPFSINRYLYQRFTFQCGFHQRLLSQNEELAFYLRYIIIRDSKKF